MMEDAAAFAIILAVLCFGACVVSKYNPGYYTYRIAVSAGLSMWILLIVAVIFLKRSLRAKDEPLTDSDVEEELQLLQEAVSGAKLYVWLCYIFLPLVFTGIDLVSGNPWFQPFSSGLFCYFTLIPVMLVTTFLIGGVERAMLGQKTGWWQLLPFLVTEGTTVFVTHNGKFDRIAYPGWNWRSLFFETSNIKVPTTVQHLSLKVHSVTSDGVPVDLGVNIEAVINSPDLYCRTYFLESNVVEVLSRIIREHIEQALRSYCADVIRESKVPLANAVMRGLASNTGVTPRTGYTVLRVEMLQINLSAGYSRALDDRRAIPHIVAVAQAKQDVEVSGLHRKVDAVVTGLPVSFIEALGRRIAGQSQQPALELDADEQDDEDRDWDEDDEANEA
jgi:hypothetical protein